MSKQKHKLTPKDYLSISANYLCLLFFSSNEALPHINSFYLKNYISPSCSYNTIFYISIALTNFSSFIKFFGLSFVNIYPHKQLISFSYLFILLSSILLVLLPYFGYALFFLSIYSLGSSFCYFLIINSLWKIFPFHKGTILGMASGVTGIGTLSWRALFDFLNHDIKKYYLTLVTMTIVFFFISIVSIKIEEVKTVDTSNIKCENLELSKSINESDDYENELSESGKDSSSESITRGPISRSKHRIKSYFRKVSKSIFTKKFSYILIAYILVSSGLYSISSSYLSYGIINKIPYIPYTNCFYLLFLSLFSIFWGVLHDLRGFRQWIAVIVIIQLLSYIALFFSNSFKWMILVSGLINSISFSGVNSLFFPMTSKEIGGDCAIDVVAIMGIIGENVKLSISILMKYLCWNNTGFIGIYFFSAVFIIISVVMVYKLIFPDNSKDKNNVFTKKIWIEQDKLRELRKE